MRVAKITAIILASATSWAAAPARGIEQLGWLQGCWQLASADRVVEEQWTAPRGGSMLGVSRTVRGGELVDYEFVIIRERGGQLVYHAHPSGQPSAEFVFASGSETGVVFENANHDFPQRIGYSRQGASLMAWVEGSKAGATRRLEFQYQRVGCAGE